MRCQESPKSLLCVGVQVGDAAGVEADLAAVGVDASTGLLQ
jgi:hypothetical protein